MSNVQWSSPVPCVPAGRTGHKRVDEPPVSKCARQSDASGVGGDTAAAAGLLGRPPVSSVPVSGSPTHRGGSTRIGQFLLLRPAEGEAGEGEEEEEEEEEEEVYTALDFTTGEELLCKVFPLGVYQERVRPYTIAPPHRHVAGLRHIILGDARAYVFRGGNHGDLHGLVKGEGRLTEGRAAPLFHQAALAVAHCHAHGLVLGDLRLRTFVFADDARTHLLLEGLEDCRVLRHDDNDDLITDAHLSPEALRGPAPHSGGKMADAWSLGMVLYAMLAGRHPFHAARPAAAFFTEVPRGGHLGLPGDLSAAARCLLRCLLKRDPRHRLSVQEALGHPWFRLQHQHQQQQQQQQQQRRTQEVGVSEQEVSSAEQTVPLSRATEDEEDLFY